MFKKILDYFARLIDSKSSDDSKVFVGLGAFLYVIVAGFANLFWGFKPDETVFFGILGLVISVFSLTTYVKQKSMTIKGEVASEIVAEDSSKQTSESAKEVLQSDKP